MQGVKGGGTTATYANSVDGIEELAHIFSQWPKIAELGGSGYLSGYPGRGGAVSVSVALPNSTSSQLRSVMEPIMRTVRTKKKRAIRAEFVDDGEYKEYAIWDDARLATIPVREHGDGSVQRAVQDGDAEQGGFPGLGQNKIIVSWLYSAKDVSQPGLQAALAGAFDSSAQLLNDATMGAGTLNPPFIRGGGNAVNPAFRGAIMRPASELQWSGTDPATMAKRKADAQRFGASLRSVSPGGGTYVELVFYHNANKS